jgi:RHS repeat-associated protein
VHGQGIPDLTEGNLNLNYGGADGGLPSGGPALVHRYKGQYGYVTDTESNLIYCQNRFYDPYSARWITRDPSGLDGGINTYQYCLGDPINNVDPDGSQALPQEAAAAEEPVWLELVYGGGGEEAAGLGVTSKLGIYGAVAAAGWIVGRVIDNAFGISSFITYHTSGEAAFYARQAQTPLPGQIKQWWINSSGAQRLELEEQYPVELGFIANLRRADPSGQVEAHHLLPSEFEDYSAGAGLEINEERFMKILGREDHKLLHGKYGDLFWKTSWNRRWEQFIAQYPTPNAHNIIKFLLLLRSQFKL